jgi:hypothetical protein
MGMSRKMGLAAGALLVAVAAGACARNSGGFAGTAKVSKPQANLAVGRSATAQSAPPARSFAPAALPVVGPSIIKTADVAVEVAQQRFKSAVQSAMAAAGRYGGFVVSTNLDTQGKGFGSIVLRVPAHSFVAALGDLKSLGAVRRENVSGRDVTQQVVDLQARLRNYRAQEAVLLRLMDRAKTVSATIVVEQHLQQVQLAIEEIQGRLRYLHNQTAMSTITLTLEVAGAAPVKQGIMARAWQEAVRVAMSVVSAVIVSLGFVVPVGLLLGMALLAYKQLRPRLSS